MLTILLGQTFPTLKKTDKMSFCQLTCSANFARGDAFRVPLRESLESRMDATVIQSRRGVHASRLARCRRIDANASTARTTRNPVDRSSSASDYRVRLKGNSWKRRLESANRQLAPQERQAGFDQKPNSFSSF